MPATIRLADRNDAVQWQELLYAAVGYDYPAREVYDVAWVAEQLELGSGHETWVAEVDGHLHASVTFLAPADVNINPIANLGRNLYRPESHDNGAAFDLLRHVAALAAERGQMIVARVPAADNRQQKLLESIGCVCVGYQPHKHLLQTRQGILFYVLPAQPLLGARLPLSESLPQVSELAGLVLDKLQLSRSPLVRDGVTGYPLHSELKLHDASYTDYEVWRQQLQKTNRPAEVSTGSNPGCGLLRIQNDAALRALLAQHETRIVAGLAYVHDEQDRCVRILDAFSTDDVSVGTLFQHILRVAEENLSAAYVEVDLLMTAPRLLKTAEQLGFVPVAYLPGFFTQPDFSTDVVKLVKLNTSYDLEFTALTDDAAAIVGTIDHNFEYYKSGVTVVNLLRGLPLFEGLGDGELRKIARLFAQKLYRPGEPVFAKGDPGDHAYVVMRGQLDITLNPGEAPVGSVRAGQILGELAFLDGAPRHAAATASLPSILLIVQRDAFNQLIQQEAHLGLAIMRNIARDLSHKLRRSTTSLVALR